MPSRSATRIWAGFLAISWDTCFISCRNSAVRVGFGIESSDPGYLDESLLRLLEARDGITQRGFGHRCRIPLLSFRLRPPPLRFSVRAVFSPRRCARSPALSLWALGETAAP